jgi:mono/diheme cytochrome c family protein
MTTGEEAVGDDVDASEGAWWAVLGAGGSLVLVLVIGAIILGAGLGDTDSQQLNTDDSGGSVDSGDVLTLGEETYATSCATCHGPQGEGGVGPSFAGVVERYPDVADHMAIIVGGRNAMPAFGPSLTDTQIDAVVAYQREVLDAGTPAG